MRENGFSVLLFIILIFLLSAVIVGSAVILKSYQSSARIIEVSKQRKDEILNSVNKQYKFQFADTSGWITTTPKSNDMKLSLVTLNGKTINSFVGVVVTPNNGLPPIKEEDIPATCAEIGKIANYSYISFTKVSINNTLGFKCVFNSDSNLYHYILFGSNGSKYDYGISVKYPKDNPEEEKKVNNLINSFSVI